MEQIKAILVGAGSMGRTWAKNLVECADINLVGWVDIRPEAARAGAEGLGRPTLPVAATLAEMLGLVQTDCVVDVSIPEAHHDVTLEALAQRIPVLGEKPMADTMERARAMVAAAERAQTLYMISQNRRYNPGLATLRDTIRNHIGPPGILNTDFYLGPHFGGFREVMANPLLLDMAIHTFDAARYVSDTDPVSVYCDEFNPSWSWYTGAACATAIFEMTGGLRYTYRGGWCASGVATAWDAQWRAVGPEGTATWDGERAVHCQREEDRDGFFARVQDITPALPDWEHSGIAASLRDFVRALRTGATPMGECHDNIKSLAMVFAAIESAATHQVVRISV